MKSRNLVCVCVFFFLPFFFLLLVGGGALHEWLQNQFKKIFSLL